jgi:hypothetical protein
MLLGSSDRSEACGSKHYRSKDQHCCHIARESPSRVNRFQDTCQLCSEVECN